LDQFYQFGNPNGPACRTGLPTKPTDQLMNFTNDELKGMADALKPRLDVAESKAK
jgi:hypothetical protein